MMLSGLLVFIWKSCVCIRVLTVPVRGVGRELGAELIEIPVEEGEEQVGCGVGVVFLFLECSLCSIKTLQQWEGQELRNSGLPLSSTIYAEIQ